MGFFSWQCAKSNKPVMAQPAVVNGPWQFASQVIVLFNDGNRVNGTYDGYGRVLSNIGEVELVDIPDKYWRMVIEKYYNGETFDQWGQNKHDPGQGFFYSDEELEEIFGVK
jgi:hypothetical protein